MNIKMTATAEPHKMKTAMDENSAPSKTAVERYVLAIYNI
jgi:hypothetical protein